MKKTTFLKQGTPQITRKRTSQPSRAHAPRRATPAVMAVPDPLLAASPSPRASASRARRARCARRAPRARRPTPRVHGERSVITCCANAMKTTILRPRHMAQVAACPARVCARSVWRSRCDLSSKVSLTRSGCMHGCEYARWMGRRVWAVLSLMIDSGHPPLQNC